MSFCGITSTWVEAPEQMPHLVVLGFNQFEEESGCYLSFDARIFDRDEMQKFKNKIVRFFDAAAKEPTLTLGALAELIAAG